MTQETWTEDEVRTVIDCFKRELDKITTGVDLENLITTFTKAKLRKFLIAHLQESADEERATKNIVEEWAVQKETLIKKINRLS